MQKYHLLYIRILSRYSNTCVTKWIYELTEYLFQPYHIVYYDKRMRNELLELLL